MMMPVLVNYYNWYERSETAVRYRNMFLMTLVLQFSRYAMYIEG